MNRELHRALRLSAIALALAAGGCASLDAGTEARSVNTLVQQRTGAELRWQLNEADAQAIQAAVKTRLQQPLTADAAVQVALLSSPQAQRLLDQLDIAVADRTQAGLLANPFLDLAYLTPRNEGSTGLEFGLGLELLGALSLPVREKIAQGEYEAQKLAIAEALAALASRVRRAYFQAQAAQMTLAYWDEARTAAEAAGEFADRLRQAGNVSVLKQQRQKLFAAEYAMQAEQAKVSALAARERLNRLMGLTDAATGWTFADGLPPLPETPPDTQTLEQRALDASLRLQATRARLDALAQRGGLARNTRFLPELEAGYAWNREVGDGSWNSGPSLGLQLPLFDTGAARVQKLRAELRVLERQYAAEAIALRSEARVLAQRLSVQLRAARQAQLILGPLSQELSRESVLHFNAMQIGLFELLQERRRETEIAIRAIEATRDYWLAKHDLDSLLSGVQPDGMNEMAVPQASSGMAMDGGH